MEISFGASDDFMATIGVRILGASLKNNITVQYTT